MLRAMVALIAANVRRRKGRTALTAAGIAVGVATVVALLALSDGLNRTAGQLVHLGRADLGLFQRGASDPTSSVLPLSLLGPVSAQPGVRQVAPIQLVAGAVSGAPGAIVLGIEPGGFVSRLLVFTSGRSFSPGAAALGSLLARQLHVHHGSAVRLNGHRFRVAGIFHSGITEEDSGVLTTLHDAQAIAGRTSDEVTTFAVRLEPQVSAQRGVRELTRAFPNLLAISEPSEAVRAGANNQLIANAVLLIVALALIIGALAVANTMLAAVLERRRELALLATLGWSPQQLGLLVLGEAVTVSLLGTAGGLLLGIGASKLLPAALGLSAFISPELTAWGFGRAVLIGVTIGLIGAAYPIWQTTRLRPVAALTGA